MPAKWTADVVGKMHLHGITAKQLAAEIGWHEKYFSAVINGHREPSGAKETVQGALQRIVDQQDKDMA